MAAGGWDQTDELRETWIFLLLYEGSIETTSQNSPELRGWEIGVANADAMVETEARIIGAEEVGDEADLLAELMASLQPYRYQGLTLLTPSCGTVQRLRRRLTATGDGEASLRGFTHISVENVLAQYFDQTLAEYGIEPDARAGPRETATGENQFVSSGDVLEVWQCWKRVFRLIPPQGIEGDEL